MKKKMLILIVPLILTGCTIKYDLTIDSNLGVKENINITENNSILELYDDSLKLIPKQKFSQYKDIDGYEDYSLKNEIFESDKTGGIINRKFRNLEEFSSSPVFQNIYESLNITRYQNIVSVQTIGFNQSFFSSEIDPTFNVDDIEIKIRFHNVLEDSNAGSYDEKSNTYTWLIGRNSDTGLIKFDINSDKKRWDIILQDFVKDNVIQIIILTICGLTLLIFAINTYIKVRKSNKI